MGGNFFNPFAKGSPSPGLGSLAKSVAKVAGVSGPSTSSSPAATPLPVPVVASAAAVQQAQQDFIQSELMKKSIKKTVIAGDTGGYRPPVPAR